MVRLEDALGGKVVRTATGPNDKPGGTEQLDWHSWDVAEFEGKDAVITKYRLMNPGLHVDGPEQILYPIGPRQ